MTLVVILGGEGRPGAGIGGNGEIAMLSIFGRQVVEDRAADDVGAGRGGEDPGAECALDRSGFTARKGVLHVEPTTSLAAVHMRLVMVGGKGVARIWS